MKEYYALSRFSGNVRGDLCIERILGHKSIWNNAGVKFVRMVPIRNGAMAMITCNEDDKGACGNRRGNFMQATASVCRHDYVLHAAAFGFTVEEALHRLDMLIESELRLCDRRK